MQLRSEEINTWRSNNNEQFPQTQQKLSILMQYFIPYMHPELF